jgi:predicted permease
MAWWRELHFTLRRLVKSPGFVMAAVVSVGLGIAANATIFAMVSRFVLKPAAAGNPATLLSVYTTWGRGQCCNAFPWPVYADVRDQAQSLSGVAAFHELVPASVVGRGEPERVWGQATTANYFDVAQIAMAIGRGFRSDEERQPVVVLGHRLWRRQFGGDPQVLGKTATLSGKPYTIVGVAPPRFRGLDLILDCEFWVPLGTVEALAPETGNFTSRDYHWLQVIGRVKPGVTRANLTAEWNGIAERLGKAYPATDKDGGFRFEQAGSLPPRDRSSILLFLGALSTVVLLLLAIACANVTNLFLAEVSGRQKELAVRLALGATRGQIIRQMLTESVLLALAGGVFGMALSVGATQGLSAFRFPAPVPLDLNVSVDSRVLLYTLAVSLAAGLLFGFVPAWVSSRPALAKALRGQDMLARPGSRWSLRNVLVTAQIAMSLVLLCAAGLFLRSMQTASSIDIGFRSRGLAMMSVDPRLNGYSSEKTTRFLEQVRERAASLPGVTSATVTDVVPLSGGNRSDSFAAEGRPADGTITEMYMASPGYFETLGITLVAGRGFGQETAAEPKVAVVSEALAEKLFPHENPLGQRIKDGAARYEVVGVARNIKSRTLGESLRPTMYRSLAQSVGGDPSIMGYTIVVRSLAITPGLTESVRKEIHALDPALAIYNADTMESHLRDALFLPRLAGTLFGVFGFVGLTLAAVGLYGVMSYSAGRRKNEIGVRLALGAQARQVRQLIVRQGMSLVLIANAFGLAAALAVAKVAASFLYGVQPHDPATFLAVPPFLAAVALLACWLPARQAAKLDPMVTLRSE